MRLRLLQHSVIILLQSVHSGACGSFYLVEVGHLRPATTLQPVTRAMCVGAASNGTSGLFAVFRPPSGFSTLSGRQNTQFSPDAILGRCSGASKSVCCREWFCIEQTEEAQRRVLMEDCFCLAHNTSTILTKYPSMRSVAGIPIKYSSLPPFCQDTSISARKVPFVAVRHGCHLGARHVHSVRSAAGDAWSNSSQFTCATWAQRPSRTVAVAHKGGNTHADCRKNGCRKSCMFPQRARHLANIFSGQQCVCRVFVSPSQATHTS